MREARSGHAETHQEKAEKEQKKYIYTALCEGIDKIQAQT